jgi:3-methylcrotonyl-CoA carboxylase alpha subunit
MALTVVTVAPFELLVTDGDGRQHRVFVAAAGDGRWAFCEGEVWVIENAAPATHRKRAAGHESLAAPMPATVIAIPVSAGDRVTKGQTVLVLEAMKMEMPLRAAHDGTVIAVNCGVGDLVQPGITLVEIE